MLQSPTQTKESPSCHLCEDVQGDEKPLVALKNRLTTPPLHFWNRFFRQSRRRERKKERKLCTFLHPRRDRLGNDDTSCHPSLSAWRSCNSSDALSVLSFRGKRSTIDEVRRWCASVLQQPPEFCTVTCD